MKSILETLRRRWYFFLPLILVGLFLVVRSRASSGPTLAFVHPTVETIEATVDVSGNVAPEKVAKLKFLGGGKLTYLGVTEGDVVKKYQRIASIDTRDLQKSLKESLNLTKVGLNNLNQGNQNAGDLSYSTASMRALASLQSTLDNNVLDVEIKNLAIENSSLYSPFEGVVISTPTSTAGMQVTATDTFEVIDPTTLKFVAEVDEVDLSRVKLDQPVHISLDAYEGDDTKTTVVSVGLKAVPSTKASGGTVFLVKANLPSDYLRFREGMNGTMKIVTNRAENVVTIPVSDVVSRDSKSYVKVRTGKNSAVEREVQTGIESDERVEITSGLSTADEIVDVK